MNHPEAYFWNLIGHEEKSKIQFFVALFDREREKDIFTI